MVLAEIELNPVVCVSGVILPVSASPQCVCLEEEIHIDMARLCHDPRKANKHALGEKATIHAKLGRGFQNDRSFAFRYPNNP
jgi:hypothetical protein